MGKEHDNYALVAAVANDKRQKRTVRRMGVLALFAMVACAVATILTIVQPGGGRIDGTRSESGEQVALVELEAGEPPKKIEPPVASPTPEPESGSDSTSPQPFDYPALPPVQAPLAGGPGAIALTFDDGPKPGITDRLLDILAANDVRATFFVQGWRANDYQDIIRRMAGDGHQVAIHTVTHQDLTAISDADVLFEVNESIRIITDILGTPPTALRPPYGAINNHVRDLIGGKVRIVNWNVDPRDWQTLSSAASYNHVVASLRDGAVILLHDVYDPSVDAVSGIINAAKSAGYTFYTVDEMFALGKL